MAEVLQQFRGSPCDCAEAQVNIPEIDRAILLAVLHGFEYNFAPFRFCPYCGKRIEDKEGGDTG